MSDSLLKQTFDETNSHLDRIISTYKRIPPADPNYPRYLKFNFDEDITMAIKIEQGLVIGNIKKPNTIGSVSFNATSENGECYVQYKEFPEDPFTNILKFNLSTFAITGDLDSGVKTANETWITEEEYNSFTVSEYPRYLLMQDFGDSWGSPLIKIKTPPTSGSPLQSPSALEMLGFYWWNMDYENPSWGPSQLPSGGYCCSRLMNDNIEIWYVYDHDYQDTYITYNPNTFDVSSNTFESDGEGNITIGAEMADPSYSDDHYQGHYKATWITPMRAKRIVAADDIVD